MNADPTSQFRSAFIRVHPRLLPALPEYDPDAILIHFMNAIGGSTWLWIGFSLFIFTMLSLDLGLFNRKAHTIKYREAWLWSGVWITLAMIFAGIVFYYL